MKVALNTIKQTSKTYFSILHPVVDLHFLGPWSLNYDRSPSQPATIRQSLPIILNNGKMYDVSKIILCDIFQNWKYTEKKKMKKRDSNPHFPTYESRALPIRQRCHIKNKEVSDIAVFQIIETFWDLKSFSNIVYAILLIPRLLIVIYP